MPGLPKHTPPHPPHVLAIRSMWWHAGQDYTSACLVKAMTLCLTLHFTSIFHIKTTAAKIKHKLNPFLWIDTMPLNYRAGLKYLVN